MATDPGLPENGKHKGALRVWWISRVPIADDDDPFEVDVSSVEEAVSVMEILARYDGYQWDHHIRPDYTSIGGLSVWDVHDDGSVDGSLGEWVDWEDPETGEDDPAKWLATLT